MAHDTASHRHESSLRNGERYFQLGEFAKAVDFFTLIIEQDPENIRAHLRRALSHERFCVVDDRDADFDAVLRLDPDSAEACFVRGHRCELLTSSDWIGAIRHFTEAIQKDPTFTDAYEYRGWLRLDYGDIPGAIEDFDRCLEIDPGHPIAMIHRADAKGRIGDYAGQIKDYQAFLDCYPETIMREQICNWIGAAWFSLAAQAASDRRPRRPYWEADFRPCDPTSETS